MTSLKISHTLAVAAAVAVVIATAATAHAGEPDPKRKVVVLEYRSGSSALPGIATRLAAALSKQTSLAVLGPDQTRAAFGEHLDSTVVKCAGEAECVAKIGQKVGAAEVLLVGVSELGDVILTLQRIDVASRGVVARIADSLAGGTTPNDDQVSQYLHRLMPISDFLRFGVLDIIASEAGALVTVSGENRGTTPIPSLKLHAPATYDVRIEKRGFVPFTTKVQLPPDAELKVEATLSKRGAGTAWYQHWYVLAGLGIVVAGAAGGTIYVVTQTTNDQVHVSGVVQ
jgi:hypothetical protein